MDGAINTRDSGPAVVSVQRRRYLFYPVIWVRDAQGKRKQVWGDGYDTEEAAKPAERRLLASKDRNEPVAPDRETVGAFLERWIETKKASGKLAPKTLQDYEDHVRRRWIPAIGHLQMSELYARPEYILEAQTTWRTQGVDVRNRGRRPSRTTADCTTIRSRTRPRLPMTYRLWNRKRSSR
jgi:hypothetical protein